MAPAAIPAVKERLREVTLEQARELANGRSAAFERFRPATDCEPPPSYAILPAAAMKQRVSARTNHQRAGRVQAGGVAAEKGAAEPRYLSDRSGARSQKSE